MQGTKHGFAVRNKIFVGEATGVMDSPLGVRLSFNYFLSSFKLILPYSSGSSCCSQMAPDGRHSKWKRSKLSEGVLHAWCRHLFELTFPPVKTYLPPLL